MMYYDCSPAPKTSQERHNPASASDSEQPGFSELVILGAQGSTTGTSTSDQLEALIGPVRVIEPTSSEAHSSLRDLLSSNDPLPPRVLLKLRHLEADQLPESTGALVAELARAGFTLIGSDLRTSEWSALRSIGSHLAEQGVFFLEGLDLSAVPAGDYVLIALPVPINGSARCPVRVVLKSVF